MNTSQIPIPGLEKPLRILHLTDAHLGPVEEDQPRADALKGRMEDLYRLFGRDYEANFAALLKEAVAGPPLDAIFLTGDAIDFPSRAAIEAAARIIAGCPCPVLFTSGNHDWNFPYDRGSNRFRTLQRPWIGSLYAGGVAVPFDKWDIGGLRIVAVDNSTYQIDAEQLAFVREQLQEDLPTVLLLHIPITQPRLRERTVDFWTAPILLGEEMDQTKREQWSVETPAPETGEFISLLREAGNLRGIFCGHVHFDHEEAFSPTASQYVGEAAFKRGARMIEFQPA